MSKNKQRGCGRCWIVKYKHVAIFILPFVGKQNSPPS
jgi:hypothetical protein